MEKNHFFGITNILNEVITNMPAPYRKSDTVDTVASGLE